MSIGALGKALLDFLYPPRCPFCRRTQQEERICPDCQRSLPWLGGAEAERRVEHLRLCASALRYQGAVRQCVKGYKFGRKQGYARVLGPLTAQCARDHLSQDFDLVSWPPLSPKGLRRRGFDQARLLCRYVARDRGMEESPLFRKSDSSRQQSRIRGDAERRGNVLGAFTLLDPASVRGKRVLLVDDVVTSGATLSECARVLLTAGASGVWAVTLASARGHRRK